MTITETSEGQVQAVPDYGVIHGTRKRLNER